MLRGRLFAIALIAVSSLVSNMSSPARADPSVFAISAAGVAALAWAVFGPKPAHEDPDMLTLGVGSFDAVDGEARAVDLRVEYRPDYAIYYLFKPLLGIAGTTDGAIYGYAGLRVDAYLGDRFLISPNVSLTGYHQGGGKDLGSAGVLRSGIDASFRFNDGSRLGLSFHHMSHGRVFGDVNPGTETFLITCSLPL